MIPNNIHFVFGLDKNFGGEGFVFSFVHFLAVITAYEVNNPEIIYFHYAYEPTGPWWEKARPYLTLSKIDPPQEIFGNPIQHVAHKADVVRIKKLIELGGIYLDMDVVCINPFKPLLKHECVLGREPTTGLCNAVILAKKDADFLKIWYESYHNFDGSIWAYHSVKLPHLLAQKHPDLIDVQSSYKFFYPKCEDPNHALWSEKRHVLKDSRKVFRTIKQKAKRRLTLKSNENTYLPLRHHLMSRNQHFEKIKKLSYCIHLWEHQWWDKHLSHLSPEVIISGNFNFSRIIRYALRNTDINALLLQNKTN